VTGVEPALHTALAGGVGHTALYVAGEQDVPRPLAGADGIRHLLVADRDPGTFDAVLLDPDRRVAERYGIGDEGGLVLVRPDGYLGHRTELGDEAAVSSYLARGERLRQCGSAAARGGVAESLSEARQTRRPDGALADRLAALRGRSRTDPDLNRQ
jgi:hypothetical protein